MSDQETTHNMVIQLTAIELAKVHQLAGDHREPIAVLVRRWIRDSYQNRFGDTKPEAPRLKGGRILNLSK
jgi:hypothetical protein